MILQQRKQTSDSYINSLYGEKPMIGARITLFSIQTTSESLYFNKILLFFEYIQLICQIIEWGFFFTNQQETAFPQTVKYAIMLLNPCSWWMPDRSSASETVLLCFVGIFILLKLLLFGYVIWCAYKKSQGNSFLLAIWKHLYKLQGRVLYCFVTSFWVHALLIKEEERGLTIITGIVIAYEFFYSLLLTGYFYWMLPTKDFLSSKTHLIETTTLIQKLIMQILRLTFTKNSLTSLWIFTIFNVIMDLIRNSRHYYSLPLYKIKALVYQGGILAIIGSLNLAMLLCCIIKSIDEENSNFASLIVFWMVLAILAMRLSTEAIKKSFWGIVIDTSINSPGLLVHRICAIKQLKKQVRRYNKQKKGFSRITLVNEILLTNLQEILKTDSTSIGFDSKDSKNLPKIEISELSILIYSVLKELIFKNYLNKLLEQYPKNKFIQIFAANFFVKSSKLYGDAVKISQSLQTSTFSHYGLHASILLLQIQNHIKQKHSSNQYLDIWAYISSKLLIAQIRDKIIKQASLQIKICEESQKDSPDLALILNDSQKCNKYRKEISKKFQHAFKTVAESYLEPILLCAEYHLKLEHSLEDYLHYSKIYLQKAQRFKKVFDQSVLTNENLYQDKVGYFLISANKTDAGTIVFGSKALVDIVGGDPSLYPGSSIASLAAPCTRQVYAEFYKNLAERGKDSVLGFPIRGFSFHNEGYMIQTEWFMDLCPAVTEGFYLSAVTRLISPDEDFLYILENGDIDCATKGFSECFGILGLDRKESGIKKRLNLFEISQELAQVNEAFNMIAFPEKYSQTTVGGNEHNNNLGGKSQISGFLRRSVMNNSPISTISKEKAQEIYDLYSTTGNNIMLTSPIKTENESESNYLYNCKVTNIFFGPVFAKLVTLEPKGSTTLKGDRSPKSPDRRAKFEQLAETYRTHIQNKNTEEISNSFDEEKEAGWIDFDAINSARSPRGFSPFTAQPLMTDHPYRGDTGRKESSRHLLEAPSSPLDTPSSPFESPKISVFQRARDFSGLSPLTSRFSSAHAAEYQPEKHILGGNYESIVRKALKKPLENSELAKISQQRKISNLNKRALDQLYSPKFMRWLYILSLFIFVGMLGNRITMKVRLDYNMNRLNVKKEILRNAQLRTYQLISVQAITRIVWDVKIGTLSPSAFGPLAVNLPYYPLGVKANILALNEANKKLMDNSSLLSQDLRDVIFAKDIKMYENYFEDSDQSYSKLNTLQATDRVIETGLKVLEYLHVNSSEGTNKANFIFRNTVNDLVVKNEVLSKELLLSLDHQHSAVKSAVKIYYVFSCFGLVIVMAAVIIFITRQYRKQVFNLSAFCKINSMKINAVLLNFQNFKSQLENQDSICPSFYNDSKTPIISKKKLHENRKKEITQTPSSTNLQRNYIRIIFQMLILCIFLIALIVGTSILNWTTLTFFEETKTRIYYPVSVNSRISLALLSLRELLETNNLAHVENLSAYDELQKLLGEMNDMKNEIYDIFVDDDESDSGQIEELLSGNPCSVLPLVYNFYCNIMKSRGEKLGLIYSIERLEGLMKDKLQRYVDSDKSAAALREIKEQDSYDTMAIHLVMVAVSNNYLSELNNTKFEEKLISFKGNRMLTVTLFCCCLVLFSFAVWRLVLAKLENGVNEFKNVLRVLPGNLVLSSFPLKTFLFRTSKRIFDSVKNEI